MKIFVWNNMCIFHFKPNIVGSDQGGNWNLFLDYENKLSNVTLIFVDDRHFSAHKGSKISINTEVVIIQPTSTLLLAKLSMEKG